MESLEKPKNCAECEHYDGTCLLSPKKWESWRLMEVRPQEWCPLKNSSDQIHKSVHFERGDYGKTDI